VDDFLAEHDRIFVIEQNRDEQLKKLLTIETSVTKEKLHSLTYFGGQPLSKGHVLEGLAPFLGKQLDSQLLEVGK
jgi:2-oxoglutarate ferredoxin oxidoreductase subunit alpha